MNKVYEIITNKIVSELEKGKIPWQKPWRNEKPRNIDGRSYTGINLLLLSMAPYTCPIWATFRQIKKRGGRIKKGEKPWIVVFFKQYEITITRPAPSDNPDDNNENNNLSEIKNDEIENESENLNTERAEQTETGDTEEIITETKIIPVLRYYHIFNLEQTTLDVNQYWKPVNKKIIPNEKAESIIKNMPDSPTIYHDSKNAFYLMDRDEIHLPPQKLFISTEEYYSTLFHELVHSTGHQKRLNRKTLTSKPAFGSKLYSKEELIAEIGSAFLCAECGMEKTIKNHAAYIRGWLKILKKDKRIIFHAASQAEKAVKYLIG